MTCHEKRLQQLEQLQGGNDEVTYCVDVLSYGNFAVSETYKFQTMQEAKEHYESLIKPHGPYYPGFVRKYAIIPF